MKQSTVGIGIAFFLFTAGAGIWFFAGEDSGNFFSPGERQIAFAQGAFAKEMNSDRDQDGPPLLPPPLPGTFSSETSPAVEPGVALPPPPHDPWAVNSEPRYTQVSYTQKVEPSPQQQPLNEPTRLTPRQEEPNYLIRGQLPPGNLTRKETGKANPLREEDSNESVAPQNLPKPNGLTAQPLPTAPPLPEPRSMTPQPTSPITQAAGNIQGERSSFADFPTPPISQQDSILESAGFPVSPSPPPPAAPLAALPEPPRDIEPAPLAPSPLRSADPFVTESNAEAVPPIMATPQPPVERRVSTAEPIAVGHVSSIDRPMLSTSERSSEFGQTTLNVNADARTDVRQNEGTGMPGASALEGTQTAHLTVEKVLPSEIILEQPATIKLLIKNTGRSTAKKITVKDRIPQGTRLLSCAPETTPNENGELFWSLGNLDPNEQLVVEMRILPLREGEIGSVATVNYSAEASSRINVARPMLKVEVKAPQEVRLGDVVNLEIVISNPGTATATGIVLVEHIPDGLYHKDGKVLENRNIESLKPKEKKVLALSLTCTGPGNLVNHVVVKANNNLAVEDKTTIRAMAPILKLGIAGPRQRFLERKASYRLVVSNSGTASAQNVDLVATLPSAVKFVSTNQSGVYEPQTHTVHWALEELPAQEAGEIELVVLPTQIGEHSIRFVGNGQNNLKAEDVKTMTIDGLPALSFEVVGSSNLVEVGKDVVYEIRVANKGTKSANNVRVQAQLSDGMTFIKAEGTPSQSKNGIVAFSSLSQLEAKGEKVFKITARCNADGDHRLSVQVVSDDLSSPITKEESTRVFQ